MTTARLDNVTHADLQVATGHAPEFGDAVNQAAVFVSEFAAVQRHYPILFRRDDEGMLHAFAILGLERDENLFLRPGGIWDAGYVPAILRRGPFLIGRTGEGDPVIHIDLDHPRIVADGGAVATAPVVAPHGGHAPALEAAIEALRTIHLGAEAEADFSQLLDELALVEPVRLEIALTDRDVVTFGGYEAITAEQIAALGGPALARLNAAGLLEPVVLAAASLAAMRDLADRKLAAGHR